MGGCIRDVQGHTSAVAVDVVVVVVVVVVVDFSNDSVCS